MAEGRRWVATWATSEWVIVNKHGVFRCFAVFVRLVAGAASYERLRMVMNASPRESVSGDGTLMKALFTVKGTNEQRCELALEQVQAWDNTRPDAPPYEMLVTVESGAFAVAGTGSRAGRMVALGIAVVVLLVIIAVVAARKSRRAAAIHGPREHAEDAAP